MEPHFGDARSVTRNTKGKPQTRKVIMIEKTQAWIAGDKAFATLTEAQRYELEAVIGLTISHKPKGREISATEANCEYSMDEIVNALLKQSEKIVDILTTSETSRPRARKVNRVRTKKIKTEPAPSGEGNGVTA
jgi:hypothetical protein